MSKKSVKQIVFCAILLALAFITSYIRLFNMPWGGAVTLFSMLFIVLAANWYGTGSGIVLGVALGILVFLQAPIFLSIPQFCLDYLVSFGALGLAGLFRNRKHGLVIGYIVGILGRGVFATIAGYIFWATYIPPEFPKAIEGLYSVVYNFSYILAEGLITCIVISIPQVSKALNMVKKMALEEQDRI